MLIRIQDARSSYQYYELALRNTLAASFPSSSVDGCFFHFCQAVMNAVKRLGYKEVYERVTTDPSTDDLD